MKKVIVIGAGQLGSRHVQALKSVKVELSIQVIDPAQASLDLTKQRFEQVAGSGAKHKIQFMTELHQSSPQEIDFAIIATNSNVRYQALERLIKNFKVKYVLLEKVLFSEPQQYQQALSLIANSDIKAWVNCCMREIEIYQKVKKLICGSERVNFLVSASRFGLLTNLIHYVDHMCHILNSTSFAVDTSGLDLNLIPSKRPGFYEATGRLSIKFDDGSFGSFINFMQGESDIIVEIFSGNERFLVREIEGRAWHKGASTDYQWVELDAVLTPQSILTTRLVENIFENGECLLPQLSESAAIHLALYEPIRRHFGLNSYSWT